MTKRVLLFGYQGQLGGGLMELAKGGGWSIEAYDIDDAPFTDPERCAQLATRADADIIVNAAAYTAVDKAEDDEDLAYLVNAVTPGAIAAAAAERGAPFVHVSTDYVFDGAADAPYAEDDPPNPQSAYGRTKLAGERAVLDAHPHSVVIRTAWVFSKRGGNFVKTMLRLAETREEIGVVGDQYGGPTCADDLAEAIFSIADRIIAPTPPPDQAYGVFHFAGAPHVSWFEFASAVFDAAAPFLDRVPDVNQISTTDFPTKAVRPANSRLDTEKINDVYGLTAPDWRPSLQAVVDALLNPKSEAV